MSKEEAIKFLNEAIINLTKDDEGDYVGMVSQEWLEGQYHSAYERGRADALKELEDFPILAAGSYEWQNGFVAGVRAVLTEARKLCGKDEHE